MEWDPCPLAFSAQLAGIGVAQGPAIVEGGGVAQWWRWFTTLANQDLTDIMTINLKVGKSVNNTRSIKRLSMYLPLSITTDANLPRVACNPQPTRVFVFVATQCRCWHGSLVSDHNKLFAHSYAARSLPYNEAGRNAVAYILLYIVYRLVFGQIGWTWVVEL